MLCHDLRFLRNRAAAQKSRDKQRRYVQELEQNNTFLKLENENLSERLACAEEQTAILTSRLDTLNNQLSQLATFVVTQIPFDGFRESAALTIKTTSVGPFNLDGSKKQELGPSVSSCSQQRTLSNRRKVSSDSATTHLPPPQNSLLSHPRRSVRILLVPRAATKMWILSLIYLAMISCLSIGMVETALVTQTSPLWFEDTVGLKNCRQSEMIFSPDQKVVEWDLGQSNWMHEWLNHPT